MKVWNPITLRRAWHRSWRQVVTACAVSVLTLLSACSTDYTTDIVGTWKDSNQERYLTIEPRQASDVAFARGDKSTSQVENGRAGSAVKHFQAVIHAPITRPEEHMTENTGVHSSMNHMSLPASMQDGILMLKVDAGEIPVLYDPVDQLIVLNGSDEYQRVPDDVAKLKLGSLMVTDARAAKH